MATLCPQCIHVQQIVYSYWLKVEELANHIAQMSETSARTTKRRDGFGSNQSQRCEYGKLGGENDHSPC
jgi:hypothetical protein